MGEVVKLGMDVEVRGSEAAAKVVAWLREQADAIESGESWPAHKAVLTVLGDCNGQFRTRVIFCNAATIERAGILALALHDTLSGGNE